MATTHDTLPIFLAPSTPSKSQSTFDLHSRLPNFSHDADSENIFDSPASDKSATVYGDSPLKPKADGLDQAGAGRKLVVTNPFHNEKTRILFKAVDDLRKWEAQKYVDIPQLVIVGGQSSGKSSLLRGLTDIPFPVSGKLCTRFPTRISMIRTPRGTPSSYRISLEKPDINASGLAQLAEDECNFVCEGSVLTEEIFTQVIKDVERDMMGISNEANGKKFNFISNVLKVEVSGPELAPLSILDLPGVISAANTVKEEEMNGITQMATEYMKQPENIIICVVSAHLDLDLQGILKLATKHVSPERLVGVLTQPDRADRPEQKEFWADFAINQGEASMECFEDDWFVVRNRCTTDPESFNMAAAEKQIFGTAPWNQVLNRRRGTAVLKAHIADILSNKVRSKLPQIKWEIERLLSEKEVKRATLGEARTDKSSREKFLRDHLEIMKHYATLATENPGRDIDESLRLHGNVRRLNDHFDASVRAFGHKWAFATTELPGETAELKAGGTASSTSSKLQPPENLPPQLQKAADFSKDFGNVLSPAHLFDEIREEFVERNTDQLPGVINPSIYPFMNSEQSWKWKSLALQHLQCIYDAIVHAVERIFNLVYVDESTIILSRELGFIIAERLKMVHQDAVAKIQAFCKLHVDPKSLVFTANPMFKTRLETRDRERLFQAMARAAGDLNQMMYEQVHHKKEVNMVLEVHDVLEIYYELSVEHFIAYVVDTVKEFVLHEQGPIKSLRGSLVNELPEDVVERMTKEDAKTLASRKQLDTDIRNMRKALNILNDAHEQTR